VPAQMVDNAPLNHVLRWPDQGMIGLQLSYIVNNNYFFTSNPKSLEKQMPLKLEKPWVYLRG
jgi:hypothetical protein